MQEFGFKSDDLLDFIGELRYYGYRITPEQCISAQNLVLALAAYGNPSDIAPRLSTYLAPILCTSTEEQESFEQYFQRWQSRSANRSTGTKEIVAKLDENTVSLKTVFDELLSWIRNHRFISTLAVSSVVIIALLPSLWKVRNYLPFSQPSSTVNGRVTDTSGVPIGNAIVRFKGQSTYSDPAGKFSVTYNETDLPAEIVVEYPGHKLVTHELTASQKDDLIIVVEKAEGGIVPSVPVRQEPTRNSLPNLIVISILTLLAIGGWVLWSSSRRSMLRKKLTRENVKVEQLFVQGAGAQFARMFALRRIAQELRRPGALGPSDLDVPATIGQTITKGIFTPVTTVRRGSPEYLVLIDRTGFNDQHASLEDEVVKRLTKSDVYISRYYFQNDPRLCRKDDAKASYISLRELAALHSNRRLIIFGDGDAFFDPVTGRLERWTGIFSNWKSRALLTPQNISDNHRRWVLEDQGFVVMPTGKESLSALADILNEIPSSVSWSRKAEPFPTVLLDRPERWFESHPPSADVLENLCEELRRFLGDEGYGWLSACAVYPMLHWDLTLYLGYKFCAEYLGGNDDWVDRKFKLLMQLPWFRRGSIPDWIRIRLISDLSFDRKRHVRKALEDLLISSLRQPKGLALPIVMERPDEKWDHGILHKALLVVNKGAMRRLLRDVIKTESPESPLRDHVFLSFMTRFRYNELVVSVPEKVYGVLSSRRKPSVRKFFTFMGTLLEPGDELLAEQSGYEFLVRPSGAIAGSRPGFLGSDVITENPPRNVKHDQAKSTAVIFDIGESRKSRLKNQKRLRIIPSASLNSPLLLYAIILGLSLKVAFSGILPNLVSPSPVQGAQSVTLIVRLTLFIILLLRLYLGSAIYFQMMYFSPKAPGRLDGKNYLLDSLTGLIPFMLFYVCALTMGDSQLGANRFPYLVVAILVSDAIVTWTYSHGLRPFRRLWVFIDMIALLVSAVMFLTTRTLGASESTSERIALTPILLVSLLDLGFMIRGREIQKRKVSQS